MKKILLFILVIIFTGYYSIGQTITGLSADTIAKSDRLTITGNNFGATEGVVKINGIVSPVSSWSATLINAYVPEALSTGPTTVQVITNAGSSNTSSIVVINRSPDGRVLWRFKADDLYIQGRAAVGPDNTVYALGINGHLYALKPNGGLKWIFKALGSVQSVSVGGNGTIYFAGGNTIYALNPNGTLKWSVADPSGAQVDVGPNVGPDGNIYAVTNDAGEGGFGLISISPDGVILWNQPGFTHGYGEAFSTKEMVFGSGQLYFVMNNVDGIHLGMQAFSLDGEFRWSVLASGQPDVAPSGRIYAMATYLTAYSPAGNVVKQYPELGISLTAPDVGPDGVFYVGNDDPDLFAVKPNGVIKWTVEETGFIKGPIVSPTNDVVVVSGYEIGLPGYVSGVSTSGQPKWMVNLPFENGGSVRPASRARFSPNGKTVYVGMDVNDYAINPYTYLYAIKPGGSDFGPEKIGEFVNSSEFEVYPNPAHDIIHVESANKGTYLLMELSGRVLFATTIEGNGNIHIDNLLPGIYLLKEVTTGQVKKVMVSQ